MTALDTSTSASVVGGSAEDGAAGVLGGAPAAPTLLIVVHGTPAPQGSKSGFAVKKGGKFTGKVAMKESSAKVNPWRQDVVAAAIEAKDEWWRTWLSTWRPIDGPLAVRMVFSFTRPQSHYRTGRNAHLLRDGAPTQPCSPPDLSKLARSTEDALTTAGIWRDDSRVVEYDRLAKVWCGEDPEALGTTGARIEIRQVGRG